MSFRRSRWCCNAVGPTRFLVFSKPFFRMCAALHRLFPQHNTFPRWPCWVSSMALPLWCVLPRFPHVPSPRSRGHAHNTTHTRHTHTTHTHSCAPFNSRCLLADALLCVLRQVCLPADDIAVYNVPVAHHPGGGDGLVCFTRVPQTISTRRGYHRPSNVKGAWREFSPAKLVPFRSPLNGWRGAMFRSQRPVWVLDGGSTALPRVLDFLLPPPRKPCVIGDAKRAMPPDVCPVTCFTPFSGGGAALAYAHDGRVLLSDMPDPDTTWLHGATSVRRVPIGRTVHHLAYLDAMSGGSRDIVNPLYAVATSTRVRDHA